MISRCPDAAAVDPYYLRHWQLDFGSHATVTHQPGAFVPGALWYITEKCELSLDLFEGYGEYYDKQYVSTDAGEIMFYTMLPPVTGQPSWGYVDLLAEGYKDWNLDRSYLREALSRCGVDFEHECS